MAHEHIASTLASHPQFIALAYRLIENAIRDSKIPTHTCVVIGGAAGILHRYNQENGDIAKTINPLNKNTRTTDIDIALWYHHICSKADFLAHNEHIKKRIEAKFSGPFLEEWKEIIEGILSKKLTHRLYITCEMEEMGSHAEMTGKINICFTIDGYEMELIEMVIHNHYYSQDRNPDFTERIDSRKVTEDVTYLYKNTIEDIDVTLFEDEEQNTRYYTEVTVPTIDRLLQQLYFVYGNKYLDGKLNHKGSDEKYFGRMKYLITYASEKCVSTLLLMQKLLFKEIGKTIELLRKRNQKVLFPMVKYLEPLIQRTASPLSKSTKSATVQGRPPLHPHSSHTPHSAAYHGSSKKGGSKPRSGDYKPKNSDSTHKPKRTVNRTRKRYTT
jgi:hypothetical protein